MYIRYSKIKLSLCIGILILNFGILFSDVHGSQITETNVVSNEFVDLTLSEYVIHSSINITSDIDFINLGFSGNGSQQAPYLIEGMVITGAASIRNLIYIENVNSNFIIQNNYFYGNGSYALEPYSDESKSSQKLVNIQNVHSSFEIKNNYFKANGSDGVILENTSYSTIKDNILEYTNYGIEIRQSRCLIINNSISNSHLTGITLLGSTDSEILNNTLKSSGSGIYIKTSDNVIISNNLIQDIIGTGIYAGQQWEISKGLIVYNNTIDQARDGIIWLADNSLISDNQILNSRGNGININQYLGGIVSLESNTIINNFIYFSSIYGISIISANNDIFLNNEIINSGSSGISMSGNYNSNTLKGSGYNIFEYNNIHNSGDKAFRIWQYTYDNSFINNNFMNNGNEISQGVDEGLSNTFEYNYWDDWIQPDDDENGIVDQPYDFIGNSDKYPLFYPSDGIAFRPIEITDDRGTITITTDITETITETTIVTIKDRRSPSIISITLFIVFSIIGVVTAFGKNPAYNKISSKLNIMERVRSQFPSAVNPSSVQDVNLNILCGGCGTTNLPLSLFCMECGVSQDR